MKCKIQLDYYIFKTKIEDDCYQKLRRIIPALPIEQPITDFLHTSYSADIAELAKEGFSFTCARPEDLPEETFSSNVLQTLAKIEKSLETMPDIKKSNITLNLESSHDAFLSKVTKVKVIEDCCTDNLQSELDEGWRMVACVPQKNSRRPDYILGRIL